MGAFRRCGSLIALSLPEMHAFSGLFGTPPPNNDAFCSAFRPHMAALASHILATRGDLLDIRDSSTQFGPVDELSDKYECGLFNEFANDKRTDEQAFDQCEQCVGNKLAGEKECASGACGHCMAYTGSCLATEKLSDVRDLVCERCGRCARPH